MDGRDVMVLLKENRDRATTSERNAIDYILAHTEDVMGMSIHQLADASFVSPSTISRLCRHLGLGGYRQFQSSLVFELARRRDSERTSIGDISPKDSVRQSIFKVTRKNIESLTITEKLNDPDTIESCVALMGQACSISLFGLGSSLLSARDLYYKLIRANVRCNVCDDWHAQLVCATNMGSEDLAIAFSYSGLTHEVIECSRRAKGRGAPSSPSRGPLTTRSLSAWPTRRSTSPRRSPSFEARRARRASRSWTSWTSSSRCT